MKILKYLTLLAPVADFIDNATRKQFDPAAEPFEVRPSYKGAQFSILIKRTK